MWPGWAACLAAGAGVPGRTAMSDERRAKHSVAKAVASGMVGVGAGVVLLDRAAQGTVQRLGREDAEVAVAVEDRHPAGVVLEHHGEGVLQCGLAGDPRLEAVGPVGDSSRTVCLVDPDPSPE